jgi:lysophospholipase L1-like esterase
MIKHFTGKEPKLFIVPANTGLDTENNFPAKKEIVNVRNSVKIERQNNGVHPAPAGYNQMGDVYYAWLKNMLNR